VPLKKGKGSEKVHAAKAHTNTKLLYRPGERGKTLGLSAESCVL
jgi:hypothetical protein